MKMRLPLLTIALLGSSLSFAASNANAQEPAPGAPPASGAEHHGAPHPHFSDADRVAFFDAHLAALHAGLQLTPDQEKLWPAVEAAMRAGAKNAAERHEKAHSEPRPANAIAWLRKLSADDIAKGETLKALADASEPLYKSLTDEQKHRLPVLLHGIRPHHASGDFTMHDDEGEDGEHDGDDSHEPHRPE